MELDLVLNIYCYSVFHASFSAIITQFLNCLMVRNLKVPHFLRATRSGFTCHSQVA